MHQRLKTYCSPITAHRGGAFHAPENTLTAFRTAHAMGAEWVETDVCVLADGTAILFHDSNFSRMCDNQENVRTSTWDTVKKLGIQDNPCSCVPESIPTLASGLKLLQSLGLSLNLELKLHGGERQELLDAVLPVIDQLWHDNTKLLITSFDTEILRMVRKQRPHSALGFICENIPENWRELASDINLTSFNPNYHCLTQELVQGITSNQIDVYAYTPNQAEKVAHMWDWGLSGVITDNLDTFASLLPSQNKEANG